MAPFLSGGGYSSESWSYILALDENMNKTKFKLSIKQHGDLESLEFWEGLPQETKNLAVKLYQTECRVNETIVICHSEPGAWYPPLFQTMPCPPTDYENFNFVIGRTMFETDRVNAEHVKRCNRMDYVWVPTDFHVSTFVQSGVDPSKGNLVLGSRKKDLDSKTGFVFLSVFKWEYRKGWDVLLKAYLKEFSGIDGVALYLLTNPYHSDRNFGNKIVEFVEDTGIEEPVKGWAPIYVIDTHIAQVDLPRVYKAAHAFVLPSRGEEYLTEENSYPLQVDRMSKVMEGPFEGHLWAEPSIDKLQLLMRHVITNVAEANMRGRRAREDMIRRFSPHIVSGIVTDLIGNLLGRMI
ncbi:hypothetical protein OIU84_020417 [Salix udensis]|uniref:Uncharacterized protein n=1 Tax=Salix udensis TaxID=889485 RepID=A0AAD6PGA0_9ROSI|nr:hypothetical protein OIU84_020417 [Salix udensis]